MWRCDTAVTVAVVIVTIAVADVIANTIGVEGARGVVIGFVGKHIVDAEEFPEHGSLGALETLADLVQEDGVQVQQVVAQFDAEVVQQLVQPLLALPLHVEVHKQHRVGHVALAAELDGDLVTRPPLRPVMMMMMMMMVIVIICSTAKNN